MKYWSVDDLSRGRGMTPELIKTCVKNADDRRKQHRYSWNGWTKNRRMRSEVSIPLWLYLQPEIQKKYFPEEADEKDRIKALESLKRDFSKFRSHD